MFIEELRSIAKSLWPPLAAAIVGLVIWSVAVRIFNFPAYLVPGPEEVFASLRDQSAMLWSASWSTASNALIGVSVAFMGALLLSFIFLQAAFLQTALLPFAVFFQTVPIISIAPLLVIWFGFGDITVRVSAALVAFFPMLANTLSGLCSPTQNQLDLFKLFRASRWSLFWKLQLPSAFESIFVGLRVGTGLGVIGAVVGEFIAGGGLGQVVDSARTQQRTDLVFAAVILASLLGFLLISVLNLLQKMLRSERIVARR